MPINYQFLDANTGKAVSLNQVDKEMCEDTKFPYNETYYCPLFYWCVSVGSSYKIHTNQKIDREILLAYCEKHELTQEQIFLIQKYLLDKYQFSCWYSCF